MLNHIYYPLSDMFPIVEETIYVAQICMYFFLKMTTVQQRVNNIILETEKVE